MAKNELLEFLRLYFVKNSGKYHIKRIGLFGSAARGEIGDQSDIDIVVELQNPDMFDLIGIKQDIEEVFHRHVDIVRLREGMNLFLKRRIEQEAVYV